MHVVLLLPFYLSMIRQDRKIVFDNLRPFMPLYLTDHSDGHSSEPCAHFSITVYPIFYTSWSEVRSYSFLNSRQSSRMWSHVSQNRYTDVRLFIASFQGFGKTNLLSSSKMHFKALDLYFGQRDHNRAHNTGI